MRLFVPMTVIGVMSVGAIAKASPLVDWDLNGYTESASDLGAETAPATFAAPGVASGSQLARTGIAAGAGNSVNDYVAGYDYSDPVTPTNQQTPTATINTGEYVSFTIAPSAGNTLNIT